MPGNRQPRVWIRPTRLSRQATHKTAPAQCALGRAPAQCHLRTSLAAAGLRPAPHFHNGEAGLWCRAWGNMSLVPWAGPMLSEVEGPF